MILQHSIIRLGDQPLFTWVSVDSTEHEALPIPAGACCVYITEGDGRSLTREGAVVAEPDHMILSMCGRLVGEKLSHHDPGVFTSIVVHFYPEHLQSAYENSKPPLWQELEQPVTQYLYRRRLRL